MIIINFIFRKSIIKFKSKERLFSGSENANPRTPETVYVDQNSESGIFLSFTSINN